MENLLQGMPTSTITTKYDSEHRRTLDSLKGDRHKELEKLKVEAASAAASLQTLNQKLDKAMARKNILEQEVRTSMTLI